MFEVNIFLLLVILLLTFVKMLYNLIMQERKIIDKLEHDLGHFLIGEMCKSDPMRRGSAEMYKYKGLTINVDTKSKQKEKTISIRIGALEAEFKIDSCDKSSGALSPEEERLIMIWLGKNENQHSLKSIFKRPSAKKELLIIPFDLENVYEKI